jgi:hypothetical protein
MTQPKDGRTPCRRKCAFHDRPVRKTGGNGCTPPGGPQRWARISVEVTEARCAPSTGIVAGKNSGKLLANMLEVMFSETGWPELCTVL